MFTSCYFHLHKSEETSCKTILSIIEISGKYLHNSVTAQAENNNFVLAGGVSCRSQTKVTLLQMAYTIFWSVWISDSLLFQFHSLTDKPTVLNHYAYI